MFTLRCLLLVATLALALPLTPVWAAEEEGGGLMDQLPWTIGPDTARMQSIAQVDVPEGFMFTDGDGTRALLQAMGNLTGDSELGFISPTSMVWFVVFEFSDVGYVKDDDKDELDADDMLKQIRDNNKLANKERSRLGMAPMTIVGWEQPPKYDPVSNNLEWAIRLEVEGNTSINYNTRLLGRKGVMEVSLVTDPEDLSAALPEFRSLLSGYSFQSGEKYAEYREGDKLAKYGLAALVVGGAAAAGAKLGLFTAIAVFFKKAWKVVVIAVIAVASFFRRLIFGRGRSQEVEQE